MRLLHRHPDPLATELDVALDGMTEPTDAPVPASELADLLTVARQMQLWATSDQSSQNGSSLPSWSTIVHEASQPRIGFPAKPAASPAPRNRLRFGELTTAVTVAAVLALGAFGTALIERNRQASSPVPPLQPSVFVSSAGDDYLTPIDPITLSDLPGSFPPRSGTPGPPIADSSSSLAWKASTDGSTIVSIDWHLGSTTFRVFDTATGRLRSTFSQDPAGPTSLSADGSRLLVPDQQGGSSASWLIFDTVRGQAIQMVQIDDVMLLQTTSALLAPDASALYVLAYPDGWTSDQPPPTSLRLLSYDLSTGGLALDLVIDGLTPDATASFDGSDATQSFRSPGWAISPDGEKIVYAPPDPPGVRVIDLERRAVTSWPVDLSSNPSATPPAKHSYPCQQSATLVFATFSGDGKRVLLSGVETHCDGGTTGDYRSLGLRSLNLETGSVVTSTDTDGVYLIGPQFTGSSIYATKYVRDDSGKPVAIDPAIIDAPDTYILRLNAENLDVEASRFLGNGPGQLLVIPLAEGSLDRFLLGVRGFTPASTSSTYLGRLRSNRSVVRE